MNLTFRLSSKLFLSLLAAMLIFVAGAMAQTPSGILRGQVVDPSGAAVAGATVVVLHSEGASNTAITTRDGSYEVKALAPGKYTVQVFAQGFAQFEAKDVAISAAGPVVLNVKLTIQERQEKVVVSDSTTQIDTSSGSNANSITLKGKDLEALSDDPDELQDELTALAGPSAGPNGGQIYIDGFTAGQLPPKSSIREIRLNQNPFSAEYDKLGYGRIEIFTKPGTDKFHGQFMLNGNDSAFNARNPFGGDTAQPGYHSILYSGNVGGPLGKKASFFFNLDRRNIDEISVIDTPALDANFNPIQFTGAVPNPRTRTNLTPRLDYQLSSTNALTARYQYYRENETNNGIGQFSLPTQGFDELNTEHTLQVSDTKTLGEHVINETRFQFVRSSSSQTALNITPTVTVGGAFTAGGNAQGNLLQTTDGYEIQNYTSIAKGKHFIKFGLRSRLDRDSANKTQGFNGTFTFDSLTSYQITEQDLQAGDTAAQIRADCRGSSSTGAPICGGASLFSITTGNSLVQNDYFDIGLYVQDEWRVRPNITVNYGLRYERQNQIADNGGLAPRLGVAWGLGKTKQGAPKAVLRAGFGIFYDRFKQQYLEQAQLLDGVSEQSFVVNSPDFFPSLPTAAELAASQSAPTMYQVDVHLKTPYTMQAGVTLEKSIGRIANLAFTYLNSRGVHELLLRNINAPLPPTYVSTDRPLGGDGNVYQYQTGGDFKQNQFIINGNVRAGSRLSLFGYYTLNYANSDVSGVGGGGGPGPGNQAVLGFPSNQYDLAADYGRASFDIRQRLFLGGSIGLPYSFRVSPFMIASSGVPFNVTTGMDSNHDSIFNDRPTYAQFQTALAAATIPGNINFHCQPAAGANEVPINCGLGPARFSLNLRLSKTLGFGKKTQTAANSGGGPMSGGTFGRGPGGPGGGRGNRGGGMFGGGENSGQHYSLTFGISARNLLNNVNEGTPVGVDSSRIFGQANSLAGGPFGNAASNRRVDLQMVFSF